MFCFAVYYLFILRQCMTKETIFLRKFRHRNVRSDVRNIFQKDPLFVKTALQVQVPPNRVSIECIIIFFLKLYTTSVIANPCIASMGQDKHTSSFTGTYVFLV